MMNYKTRNLYFSEDNISKRNSYIKDSRNVPKWAVYENCTILKISGSENGLISLTINNQIGALSVKFLWNCHKCTASWVINLHNGIDLSNLKSSSVCLLSMYVSVMHIFGMSEVLWPNKSTKWLTDPLCIVATYIPYKTD